MDTLTISARRDGLACRLIVHVPVDFPMEVWEVTLVNETPRPRELTWSGQAQALWRRSGQGP